MYLLTVDRLKDAALVSLTAMCAMLFYDARELRTELRRIETSYTKFLSKKSGGRQLYTLINQTTLGVFPVSETEVIVCGKSTVQSYLQKP